MKEKIAISLDKDLLAELEQAVDGSLLRSRSQAIEYFLRKGLQDKDVTTAVIMLHRHHHAIALKMVQGHELLRNQLEWFSSHGITKVFIITQHSPLLTKILLMTSAAPVAVEIVEVDAKGNGEALKSLKENIGGPFVAMSGDTLNRFDLRRMIRFHLRSNVVATMGLMDRREPSKYGSAVLSGNRIIKFAEKPKKATSHVVNAGIYIFSSKVFPHLHSVVSLERDLFPKLARQNELIGYFTHGEYMHIT
ncbi:MAG: hypothetical protein KJ709_06060 [Nanoarchaeota archaeon]|nr:hypothetical protein [Nanoarchaeota archaeon]